MEWLASAVSKIQLSIQESTDEFLAEQAKFCGDAAQLDLPPPPTAPRAPAAELSGDASAGAHGLEHGIGQAEAWLKGRADQFKHVGLVMLNPLGDDEGDDAAVRAAASAAERLPWERPELSAAVRAQMSALSKDHMAFLTMPPEEAPFSFDLTLAMPTILRLLQADPQIERWRFLLVPKRSRPLRRPPPAALRRCGARCATRALTVHRRARARAAASPRAESARATFFGITFFSSPSSRATCRPRWPTRRRPLRPRSAGPPRARRRRRPTRWAAQWSHWSHHLRASLSILR